MPTSITIVPVLWALIGGSAAVLLAVSSDFVLLAAGLLFIGLCARGTHTRCSRHQLTRYECETIETVRSATIVRRQDFTDDLFVLWLRPDAPFAFSAGQYITIGIADIERPYSIVSAPFESVIELFIERVPAEHGGALTPLLHRSRVGDTLTIRPSAKGRFTLRPTVRHHIMVATVTGIAPFVSMLRQSMHDRILGAAVDHRFFVLHGASFADEFVYDRELRQLSEAHRGVVDYVPSVSRPAASRNATWRGAVGRVNEILTDHLASWSPPPDDSVIYLCGHPEMIKDARRRVAPQGWTVAQEQYWAA